MNVINVEDLEVTFEETPVALLLKAFAAYQETTNALIENLVRQNVELNRQIFHRSGDDA